MQSEILRTVACNFRSRRRTIWYAQWRLRDIAVLRQQRGFQPMNSAWRVWFGLGLAGILAAGAPAAEPASGWRGNATGLWPDCTAPLEWHRLARGAMEGLRGQAGRPGQADSGNAPPIQKGLPAEWLVLGPLPVADSVANLDDDLL